MARACVLGRLLLLDVGGIHAAVRRVALLGARGVGGQVGVGAVLGGPRCGRRGGAVILLFARRPSSVRAALALGGHQAVPGFVVVHVEGCAQLGQLLVGEALFVEEAVHRLGGGQRQRGIDARERRLLARGARRAGGGQIELGDGAFHHDVAGGIPARGVHVLAGVGVQEHVVQHDVEVGPCELVRLGRIEAREREGVVAQVQAVGGERGARHGEGVQARERGVHETQVHEQGVFREVEGLAGKRTCGYRTPWGLLRRRCVRRRGCRLGVRAPASCCAGCVLAIAATGSVAWGRRPVNKRIGDKFSGGSTKPCLWMIWCSTMLETPIEELIVHAHQNMPTLSVADVAVADAARAVDGEVWSPQLPSYREWAARNGAEGTDGDLLVIGSLGMGLSDEEREELLAQAGGQARRDEAAAPDSPGGGAAGLRGAVGVRRDEDGYAIVAVDLRCFAAAVGHAEGLVAVLPALIDGVPVVRIAAEAFARRFVQGVGVRLLVIPDTVERIGANAFLALSAQRIHLGAGVRILGEQPCDLAGVSPRLMRREYSVAARNGRFCAQGGNLFADEGSCAPVHGLALPRAHRSACGYRAHRPRCVRCGMRASLGGGVPGHARARGCEGVGRRRVALPARSAGAPRACGARRAACGAARGGTRRMLV